MSLPPLTHWETTRDSLHRASQVISTVAKSGRARDPRFFTHLALPIVTREGLSTGETAYGTFTLDFPRKSLLFQHGKAAAILLEGHNQVTLTDALLDILDPAPEVDRSTLTDETPFAIDSALAAEYGQALYVIASAIQAFTSTLEGEKTPLVLWPHGFDLSTLWFPGAASSEADPHMNFGFSPGSAGLPRPYLYSYVTPIPAGYRDIALPEHTRWSPAGWTGTVLDYDALVGLDNPQAFIEAHFRVIYEAVRPLMGA